MLIIYPQAEDKSKNEMDNGGEKMKILQLIMVSVFEYSNKVVWTLIGLVWKFEADNFQLIMPTQEKVLCLRPGFKLGAESQGLLRQRGQKQAHEQRIC